MSDRSELIVPLSDTMMPSQIPRKILANGAAGQFAGLVVPALAPLGAEVQGFIHKPAESAAVRNAGVAEVCIGDIADRFCLDSALAGVDAVFYLAPAFLPNQTEVGKAVAAAAIAAGVRRFVFSSVIHTVINTLSNHAAKALAEAAVFESDLDYTFLHPALFFQNYASAWPRIVKTGVVTEPWSNDTRFSRADHRDVAEAAAIALKDDRLLYGTFGLAAEGWLDRHDVAALLGEVLGRPIEAKRTDPKSLGDRARPMRPMFKHYDRDSLRGNALTRRVLLGGEPRSASLFPGLAAGNRKN